MKFSKIWLTKRWLWRCNVYVDNGKTLYIELADIDLKELIIKLGNINHNQEKVSFKWFNNI